jgi:hypothetical protein
VQKEPIRIDITVIASGGTYDYIRSEYVPPGFLWCLQGISYENETGARGTFRRGREETGVIAWDAEHQSPGSGELIFTDKQVFVKPGERLVIRQATCTSGDVLRLWAHGYRVKSDYIPGGE